jgi:hypothetical protein
MRSLFEYDDSTAKTESVQDCKLKVNRTAVIKYEYLS